MHQWIKTKKMASKASATQQEIQTTILISLVPWHDTFMQERKKAQVSSDHDLLPLVPLVVCWQWQNIGVVCCVCFRGKQRRPTYLPPHRPLHAASVQSKSRTEIISVPVLAARQAHLPDGGAHVLDVGVEGATAEVPSLSMSKKL